MEIIAERAILSKLINVLKFSPRTDVAGKTMAI
jgi:hypothetical protein